MIGRFHAQAIRDMTGGSLHSILDRNQDRAEELASRVRCKSLLRHRCLPRGPGARDCHRGNPEWSPP